MPQVTCPECRHEVACPDNYVGKMWRCPDCATRFVPRLDEPSTAPEPAAPTRTTRPRPAAPSAAGSRWLEWLIAAAIGALLASWWWLHAS